MTSTSQTAPSDETPGWILILRVAASFGEAGATKEDLAVECWKRHADRFGLKQYRNRYSDAASVFTKLFGAVGLTGLEYVEKRGDRFYVTPKGLKQLARIDRKAAKT